MISNTTHTNEVDWERRACPNSTCAAEPWFVKQIPAFLDLWWVATDPQVTRAMVAAPTPTCPRCGKTLSSTVNLDQL
jgi:hypothetical protein